MGQIAKMSQRKKTVAKDQWYGEELMWNSKI